MFKKCNKKGMVVTEEEHEKWHKQNGSCGDSKGHDACMKKCGITIKKTIDRIDKDIKNNKNLSPKFSSSDSANKYLDSL